MQLVIIPLIFFSGLIGGSALAIGAFKPSDLQNLESLAFGLLRILLGTLVACIVATLALVLTRSMKVYSWWLIISVLTLTTLCVTGLWCSFALYMFVTSQNPVLPLVIPVAFFLTSSLAGFGLIRLAKKSPLTAFETFASRPK